MNEKNFSLSDQFESRPPRLERVVMPERGPTAKSCTGHHRAGCSILRQWAMRARGICRQFDHLISRSILEKPAKPLTNKE